MEKAEIVKPTYLAAVAKNLNRLQSTRQFQLHLNEHIAYIQDMSDKN